MPLRFAVKRKRSRRVNENEKRSQLFRYRHDTAQSVSNQPNVLHFPAKDVKKANNNSVVALDVTNAIGWEYDDLHLAAEKSCVMRETHVREESL